MRLPVFTHPFLTGPQAFLVCRAFDAFLLHLNGLGLLVEAFKQTSLDQLDAIRRR